MSRYNYRNRPKGPTKVTLSWNSMINAYDLKFHDTNQWEQIQNVITWIKQSVPYGPDRDYNPETKIWGVTEKYALQLKQLIEALHNSFDFTFMEKPAYQPGSNFTQQEVPIEKYKKIFEIITTSAIDTDHLTYGEAKKIYRTWAMKLHPDRNPGNNEAASKMSELNTAWTNLEIHFFKAKEVAAQVQ